MARSVEPDSESGVNVAHLTRLTRREWSVARAVADGLSYAETAVRLGISPHTVATHVKAILQKTHLTSSRKLAALIRDFDLAKARDRGNT